MTKKLIFTAIALCAGAFANAGTIGVIDSSKFINPTVEHFAGSDVKRANYTFGSGLSYASLGGGSDFVITNGDYAFGPMGGAVATGLDYEGFFATDITPERASSTFEFRFAGGVTRFGFSGGESGGGDNLLDDGKMDLEFYDVNDVRIDPLSSFQTANGGLFSLSDFNAFEVTSGAIGRVVFRNVGHVALDDVMFEGAAAADVPEPASIALLGLGLAGFAVARRKQVRK